MTIDLLSIEPHKVSKDLSGYITFIYGAPKTGKAQPLETIIPTPKGFKMLKDVKVGDYVFARNGKPTKVLGVFPQGKMDTYLVTIEDGRQTECAGNHLWTVYDDKKEDSYVITTEDIFKTGVIRKGKEKKTNWYKYSIPKNDALEYSEKDFSISPYLLGVFLALADTTQKYLSLDTRRGELIDEVAYQLGASAIRDEEDSDYVHFVKDGKLIETEDVICDYEDCFINEENERRIPEEFFEGSIKQRFHLVQGFGDARGIIYSAKGGQTIISNLSYSLAVDLQHLLFSLGYCISVNQMRNHEWKIDSKSLYNVNFNYCSIEEKQRIFRTYEKKYDYDKETVKSKRDFKEKDKSLSITSIEKLDEQKEMVCIYVEDEEHLYVTNDYIVTHNTTLASQMDGALLLALEKGYNAIPGIIAQDINSWSELKQVVRQLKNPEVKKRFKCVIVDTVDVASALLEKYMCSKLGIETVGQGGWEVNGWAKTKKEFEEVFRTISMQGYGLFFISHSKEKTFKRPDGTEYNKIVPSLSNAYLNIVENMADIYGYAKQYKQEDGSSKVLLTVRAPEEEVSTGSHFKYIKPQFDFTYDSLANEINKAIEKEAALTNNAFVTEERNQAKEVQELNFDELFERVNAIIKELINNSPQEEFEKNISPKIVAIAETYLGKGKKINQCTRDQAEQLSLIADDLSELL